MMNWAATPAAQVPPHVHGDTTRGELLCRVVIYMTHCYACTCEQSASPEVGKLLHSYIKCTFTMLYL